MQSKQDGNSANARGRDDDMAVDSNQELTSQQSLPMEIDDDDEAGVDSDLDITNRQNNPKALGGDGQFSAREFDGNSHLPFRSFGNVDLAQSLRTAPGDLVTTKGDSNGLKDTVRDIRTNLSDIQ